MEALGGDAFSYERGTPVASEGWGTEPTSLNAGYEILRTFAGIEREKRLRIETRPQSLLRIETQPQFLANRNTATISCESKHGHNVIHSANHQPCEVTHIVGWHLSHLPSQPLEFSGPAG